MAKRVQFNDLSTPGDDGPITAWDWDFGDGTAHSNLQNPTHDYVDSGTYIVKLTITGSGNDGTDDVTHNITLDIPVPVADFSFIATGLSVAFTDQSEQGPSGPITNYAWDFGDGTTGGTGAGGGEFPSTGILDNFDTYGVGGLTSLGNWVGALNGWSNVLRVGDNFVHTINPTAAASVSYMSPQYGPDVEAYATIVQKDTINPANYMRIFVRCQNPTVQATCCRYQVNCAANGTWKLEKVINNSTSVLGTYTQAVVNGDKFGISVVGQVITAWWYDSAGDHAWHQVGTYTDNAADKITAAGKIGIIMQGAAGDSMMTLDDVGGGNYVAGGGGDPANPTHVYAAAGSYDVKLTVTGTGDDGTDDVTKNVVVSSGTALTAIFTSSVSGAVVSFSSQSKPGPSGPITAYDWNFGDGSAHGTTANPTHTYASSGTYTVRLTVTGTGGDGTNYVEHTVTVTVPPPGEGTIFDQFIAATNFARPAFTPTRTVRFKDKAGLDAAVADLRAGDLVIYDPASFGLAKNPLVITSNYQIHDKKLTGRAVFDFGCSHNVWDNSKIKPDYVAFTDTRTAWEAFTFRDCTNITILGGDYYSKTAGGIRIMGDMTDCKMLDVYCHDVGASGVTVQPIDSATGAWRTITGLVVRSETSRYGMWPARDNHNDKGTGFHGLINHGSSGKLDNSYFYTYAHDPLRPGERGPDGVVYPEGAGGCAAEPGTMRPTGSTTTQNNNHYWTYGENLLMRVTTNINNPAITNPGTIVGGQTGGNIINFWGPTPLNGEIHHFVGGKNCTGAMCHGTNENWDTANPQIRVLVGRSENMNQYTPSGGTEKYTSGHNIDYVDCT